MKDGSLCHIISYGHAGGVIFQDTGDSVEMAKGVFLVSTSNLYQTCNGKVTAKILLVILRDTFQAT